MICQILFYKHFMDSLVDISIITWFPAVYVVELKGHRTFQGQESKLWSSTPNHTGKKILTPSVLSGTKYQARAERATTLY